PRPSSPVQEHPPGPVVSRSQASLLYSRIIPNKSPPVSRSRPTSTGPSSIHIPARSMTTRIALFDSNWKHTMTDEYNALIANKTWVLVPRTLDMHVIRSMRIFRHKMKSDDSFERYKARLVGYGRSQQVVVDCEEIFSLIA
ncbi:retrovirus-related pol polyprotein from transposon TNT 1-94, partial [Tanacetum coccineum]